MKLIQRTALATLSMAACLTVSALAEEKKANFTLFKNVNVFDGVSETLTMDTSVLVEDNFIKNVGAASLAFSVVPSFAVSGLGHTAPSDKLNIAGIGIGGKGKVNLKNMVEQNIVALCDCDYAYADKVR